MRVELPVVRCAEVNCCLKVGFASLFSPQSCSASLYLIVRSKASPWDDLAWAVLRRAVSYPDT